jgi:signal transduction histidine kinase
MAQALRQGSTELAQASARGDALVQLQADLMATLDRELRAPADRLAGALDTLANEAAAPQQRQAVAARDAARQLRESTQDLLDLVALQAGRLVLQREAFDLAEVLVTGVARASALADRKGLALRVQLADDLGYARGDPARVQQVLLRLLQHAVQGTASGSVSLRAARQGSAVVSIEVADTGAGYAADDLARLFTPWQGGAERKSVLPNTGLALAQGLARAMGGEITATSRPGLGSTCTFTLPADQALGG